MDDIERVARAICEAQSYTYPKGNPSLEEHWLKQARAAIAAMPGWQPIETAPKDGTWVIAATESESFLARNINRHWRSIAGNDINQLRNPSRFMLIPAPSETHE